VDPISPSTAGGSPTGSRRFRHVTIVGAIGAYASIAAVCRPLTGPALLAVLAVGVPLFWLGVRRQPRSARPVGARSAVVWLGVSGVLGAYEVTLRLGPNDLAHPTLSTLADPALSTYPGRVFGYVLWLSAGAWLVSR
jgi:hypothetical protein